MTIRMLALFFTSAMAAGGASAQNPDDFVRSGKVAYRAFECAHLAGSILDQAKKKQLFDLGLSEARKVGQAYVEGLVSLDELSQGEILVTFYMDGPTSDFIAGQIYEGAGEQVWARLKADVGPDGSLEKMRQVALRRYEEKNCDLIGAKN